MEPLANGVLKADIKAAAKLMRYIEEEDTRAIDELKLLYGHTGLPMSLALPDYQAPEKAH